MQTCYKNDELYSIIISEIYYTKSCELPIGETFKNVWLIAHFNGFYMIFACEHISAGPENAITRTIMSNVFGHSHVIVDSLPL